MNTYGEMKRSTLELLNQYTIAGETVPLSYNNQSDAVHRIPGLINQALMDIRTGVKPERTVCRLEAGEDIGGGWVRHPLPPDLWRLASGGVRELRDGAPLPSNAFRLQGRRAILTPAGSYLVEYDRYPGQLPADPAESFELDEDPDVIQAACLYAAANLVMEDDPFVYASLRNEYENRLMRMVPGIAAEVSAVADAYGFFG